MLTSLAIVVGLTQLRSVGSSGLLDLALNGFVLYALFTYGFVFKNGQSPR